MLYKIFKKKESSDIFFNLNPEKLNLIFDLKSNLIFFIAKLTKFDCKIIIYI